MTTTALFTADDLSAWLGLTVTDARAEMVEKVVWGWLSPILKTASRPDNVSPTLFSQAVELGGIAHENPAGLEAYQLGEERSQFSGARRRELLEEVATGGTTPGSVPSPVGSFPPAPCYPDPARGAYPGYYR